MKKIPLTMGGFALVDDEDFDFISAIKWHSCVAPNTLYARSAKSKSVPSVRMHRVIMKVSDPKVYIDHINGNGLDNRKQNLRLCSSKQNQYNRATGKNNSIGLKGVSKSGSKFMARIKVDDDAIHLGSFATKEEAAMAYDSAAKKHFKEFSKTNF